IHSGNAAAMPDVRNEATFSFCHGSRSVWITTAILVSNCMDAPMKESFRDAPLGADLRCAIATSGNLEVPQCAIAHWGSRLRRAPGMTNKLTLAAAARGLKRLRG